MTMTNEHPGFLSLPIMPTFKSISLLLTKQELDFDTRAALLVIAFVNPLFLGSAQPVSISNFFCPSSVRPSVPVSFV